MIIIGVDPGSTATGYGVIAKNGTSAVRVASGVIRMSGRYSIPKRLSLIYGKLEEIIRDYRPDAMVVESLFHATNSQSLIKLSQVRGVVLFVGERHGLEIHEYAPNEIKRGLTGYGRADKDQVRFMVSKILNLTDVSCSDESDALAMALYHSHICSFASAVR